MEPDYNHIPPYQVEEDFLTETGDPELPEIVTSTYVCDISEGEDKTAETTWHIGEDGFFYQAPDKITLEVKIRTSRIGRDRKVVDYYINGNRCKEGWVSRVLTLSIPGWDDGIFEAKRDTATFHRKDQFVTIKQEPFDITGKSALEIIDYLQERASYVHKAFHHKYNLTSSSKTLKYDRWGLYEVAD